MVKDPLVIARISGMTAYAVGTTIIFGEIAGMVARIQNDQVECSRLVIFEFVFCFLYFLFATSCSALLVAQMLRGRFLPVRVLWIRIVMLQVNRFYRSMWLHICIALRAGITIVERISGDSTKLG